MKLGLILVILLLGSVLTLYVMLEKRLGLKACAVCGYKASREAAGQPCPRCNAEL